MGTTVTSDGPLARFRKLVNSGALTADPVQELAAEKLQSLHHAVQNYQPRTGRAGWRERLGLTRRREPDPPQGLYLFGGVGRGKSMLMDMFFETAPVPEKRRVHFHAFMQEVQDRLHFARQDNRRGEALAVDDAMPELARNLAEEAWLLCFDEFHVTDIADAMILGRLFTHLFDHGVVVVATSNWAPERLYEDGLNRQRFLPFIDLLQERLDVLELEGDRDYRLGRLTSMTTYHTPLGPQADARMVDAFDRLTEGAVSRPDHLMVRGRRLPIAKAARGVAWFTFEELCSRALGASDYLALATHYQTIFVKDVPILDDDRRDETKRFMTLVDACYEHRAKLIISADAPPDSLCTGRSYGFEFQRTASRLMEMQSHDYLGTRHLT